MIDAHVHVWSLDADRYPWHQTLSHVPIPSTPASVDMLLRQMDIAGVSHAVLVQPSVYGWDNSYLRDCLMRYPGRFAGIFLIEPRSTRAADDLRLHYERDCCQGIRINLLAAADAEWILADDCRRLWDCAAELGTVVCVQILPGQAETVRRLAARESAITFVVDYIGSAAAHAAPGHEALRVLSAEPNVYAKILAAGQDSNEEYPFQDLWPLCETAIAAFGPERLMFGTDFPHVLAACSYDQATKWLDDIPSVDEQARRLIGEETVRRLLSFNDSIGGTV